MCKVLNSEEMHEAWKHGVIYGEHYVVKYSYIASDGYEVRSTKNYFTMSKGRSEEVLARFKKDEQGKYNKIFGVYYQ